MFIAKLCLTPITFIYIDSTCTSYNNHWNVGKQALYGIVCNFWMTLFFAVCLRDRSTNNILEFHSLNLLYVQFVTVCVRTLTCLHEITCAFVWPESKVCMCVYVHSHTYVWSGEHIHYVCVGTSSSANAASLSPHYVCFTKQTSLHSWSHSCLCLWISKSGHKQ